MERKKIRIAITLVLMVLMLFNSIFVNAQNKIPALTNKTDKEIRATAKNSLRLGDTYTALFYYEEWSRRKPDKIKIAYQVAELYRVTRDYIQAEIWYSKIAKNNSNDYPLSLYYLATTQMSLQKYEEAKANFLKFKKASRGMKDRSYKKLSKTGVLSCDYALTQKDSNATAVIEHLGNSINQPHIEFSPIPIDKNTIIYGSLKDDGVNYYDVKLYDSLKVPVRKLYTAKKENEKWVSKGELTGPFNKEGINVGNGVLSEDGNRLYFTLCQKNWKNKMICQLYYSDKKNGEWEEPVKMNEEINLPNYTTTQPAVGRESKKNNEVIYFVSDRPKSRGGLDIWFTEYNKKRKTYSTPKNAGSKINTPGTEFTPYYDLQTHKLYFSSDGHIGIGGLDIFSSVGEKNKWEEPKNLKKDINSPADDIDYTYSKERKGGFLVSNREGGTALLNPTCCDDIYEFKFTEYIEINLNGIVLDSTECLSQYELYLYINSVDEDEKYLSKQITSDSCNFRLNLEPGYNYTVEIKKR